MTEQATSTYLWYVPNQGEPGFRGDTPREDHNSLETLTEHAEAIETNGWAGSLIGTGWHRPDTFTIGAALAARTTSYEPLIAIRPGYWHPANFAAAAATLDHLTGGRVRINIVSGADTVNAYGDPVTDRAGRYARTREFLQAVRLLWTQENVTYQGEHYTLDNATLGSSPVKRDGRPHPALYFGGASSEAEKVAAELADVQLFWGESYAGVGERVGRLKELSETTGRIYQPLEYGLRITVVARETSEEAWKLAEKRVEEIATGDGVKQWSRNPRHTAVGQGRLVELSKGGTVVDDILYTAPAALGAQAAGSTWLVGSFEEVADALDKYRSLGVTHFVLSNAPYLEEAERQGKNLLPLLRQKEKSAHATAAAVGS